jgi:hypothetical protein
MIASIDKIRPSKFNTRFIYRNVVFIVFGGGSFDVPLSKSDTLAAVVEWFMKGGL